MPTTATPDDPAYPAAKRAWWESALLIGLVLSLLVHLLLLWMTSSFSLRATPAAGLSDDPVVQLASLDERSLTELPSMPLPAADSSVKTTAQEQQFTIEDLSSPVSIDRSLTIGNVRIDRRGGAGGVSADGIGLEGAGGEARFFGVEARGSRFAFIVDVSGSMQDASRIGALRAALLYSIDRLLESASFCIILYSSDAVPLMGARWIRADEESKAAARAGINQISVGGSTNPLPGFDIAFKLKPSPDAVYFMTDGVFTKDVEDQLPGVIDRAIRSADRRVPIHCITFADRGAEKLMRRIARQSGGSYTHVEEPTR